MRQSLKIIRQCLQEMPAGPVKVRRPQDRAAAARRDEALDGSADPPLQALYRGLPRAGRRDLHRGRGAQGRVRRLSRRRRHQPALPLQDPRRRASRTCRRWTSLPRATCWPTWWRSSARSTSSSERSTDDRDDRDRAAEEPASSPSRRRTWSGRASIIAKYPQGRQASAVLPLLDLAQRQNEGWLPRAAMDYVADFSRHAADPRLRGRDLLHDVPTCSRSGRTIVQVCTTTPCWLRGSDDIVETCQRKLGIGPARRPRTGCSR